MMIDLNATVIIDNMNLMAALYIINRKIEPVEILTVLSIHWCTCEVNSYKIMFLAPYSVTKLFEFQEGYITSAMVGPDAFLHSQTILTLNL